MSWGAGAAVGLLAGLLSGAFGIGGGIVLVPLLALALHLGQHEAQGLTLTVLLLPIGLPAVLAYHRRNPLRLPLVAALVVGFLGGVGLGSAGAGALPDGALRAAFIAFLLLSGAVTWRSAGRPPAATGAPASAWNGVWIGAVAGVSAGLLGVGGGIVMVPLLTRRAGLSQHEAQGTSLAVMLPPVGLPGVWVYARGHAGLPWELLAPVVAGFGAGAFLGARLAVRTGGARLARAFALVTVVSALGLGWAALRSW